MTTPNDLPPGAQPASSATTSTGGPSASGAPGASGDSAHGHGRCHGPHRRARRWRWLPLGLLLAAGAFIGGRAYAHGAFGRGACGPFGRGCDAHGVMSPDRAREVATRMADHLADEVDASEPQRAELQRVLGDALPKLASHRAEVRKLARSLREALAAPVVDAAEVERVRGTMVSLADGASRTVSGALLELAGALDATQRAALAERLGEHLGE